MKIGETKVGIITGIKDYGAFVKIDEYSGLIHISEFSDDYVKNINRIVSVGEAIKVFIVEVDEEQKKVKLSYKKANIKQSKLHSIIKVYKGFNPLDIMLDEWIMKAKERMNEEKINESTEDRTKKY